MTTIFDTETPASSGTDTTPRSLGMRVPWTYPLSKIAGGRVWVHATGLADVDLWQVWHEESATKVAEFDLNTLDPGDVTLGGWTDIPELPATTVADPDEGDHYLVVHYQTGPGNFTFVYTSPATFPINSGGVTADIGVFRNGGTSNDMPNSTFASYHFADMNVVPIVSEQVINVPQAVEESTALPLTVEQQENQIIDVPQAIDRERAFTPTITQSAAISDRMWVPILTALRDCLCAELAKTPNGPPCACVILHRMSTPGDCTPGMSNQDNPGNGLAWVRKTDVINATTDVNCPTILTATFEIGYLRCIELSPDSMSMGNPDQLQLEALNAEADDAALRRVAACCKLPGTDERPIFVRQQGIGQGGCDGTIQLVTVTLPLK